MSIRITTNGLFRNYRDNLHGNRERLNARMEKVSTQRTFNSYAEDPAAASQCFQLRRSMWRADDQIETSQYMISKFSTAYNALKPMADGTDESINLNGLKDSLQAMNATSGSTRALLGVQLKTMSDSIAHVMNAKYGDEFVFAGADALNVPFVFEDNGEGAPRTLRYRGVDVNANPPMSAQSMEDFCKDTLAGEGGEMPAEPDFGTGEDFDVEGFKAWYAENRSEAEIPEDATEEEKQEIQNAEFEKAYKNWFVETNCQVNVPEDATEEEKQEIYDAAYTNASNVFDEHTYVDIGLGMMSDENGNIIKATAYDSSLNGLEYLGFGVDKDGDPNNMCALMDQLSTILGNCDEHGAFNPPEDEAVARRLVDKLSDRIKYVQEKHVALSAQVSYLEENLDQLQAIKLDMNEELETRERMDLADAITEMMWAQYSYNAALRIGNQILSQSLIDYLN